MAASIARHVRGVATASRFLCRFNSAAQLQTYNCCRYFSVTQGTLSERRYTKKHEWVLKKDKIGTVGITNYAQDALGDVVFAQLPEVGRELKAQDECGTLESVKAASDVYSPVSGKVVKTNQAVEEKPALINTSCYDEGWLFQLELSNPSEVDALMNEEQYTKYLKSQS